MKYNVGDKVRIKPKFHFCSVDGFNNINMKDEFFNEYSRLPYCETVMTIGIVNKDFYILKEDRWAYKWTDEMIEGLVEDEMPLDEAGQITDFEYDGLAYTLPEGYIFKDENGNVIEAKKIVLEKKKKEYPKTYEKCCAILGAKGDRHYFYTKKDKEDYPNEIRILDILDDMRKLLICRDAYWKIYGEEMGLGKPWKPDWKNDEQFKYIIICRRGRIVKDTYTAKDVILSFPTEEIRDAFYENFKELIEICKEFL